MKRVRISILLALGFVTFVSLGASECTDGQRMIIERVGRILAEHELRLDALEHCDCPGVLAPVCGEDGNTYGNRCEARCAQTPIASPGVCADTTCGGDRGTSCDDGSFCELRPGCDEMSIGICQEIPDPCTDEFAPVCGCDGVTYSNDCQRRTAGVPLDFRDDCSNPRVECESNGQCMAEEFCARREGICDDQLGLCIPRPDACPANVDPVCGCDDVTYSNACEASVAGASVASRGRCREVPVECSDDAECADDEFCKTRLGQCGGMGICQPVAEVCPTVSNPVCGCDGETYDNRCLAASAGVSLEDDGGCGIEICHFPPGNRDGFHTIIVAGEAVRAHLNRHDDHKGACDDDSNAYSDDDSDRHRRRRHRGRRL